MDRWQSPAHNYLRAHGDRMVAELIEFLRIPSVSTDSQYRRQVEEAANWVAGRLRETGPVSVEILETGGHPVVFAEWTGAPGQPTVLVYGHYDVQPADPLELWRSPPFVPEIRDGRIYARGASDDKGPMFIPIKVLEAYFATEGALPVNVKMMFEGEEEIGSAHLGDFITRNAARLGADFALSADGAMWQVDLPSITTGSRGLAGLNMRLQGPAKDLHSGRHGGAVPNPLHALAALIASLHQPDGTVAVDGFYDRVQELDATQRDALAALPFDADAYYQEVGITKGCGEPGYSILERLWSRPTLEVNGMGGGYQGEGGKTVIPATAQAKITCRLVPDQRPEEILELVERHLQTHASPYVKLHIERLPGSAAPYRIQSSHPGLKVARSVLGECYGTEPVDVMIGGTLPVSEMFARILGIDTVYFSFSTADEDFHAPNEYFRLSRFHQGLHVWAEYWDTLGRGASG